MFSNEIHHRNIDSFDMLSIFNKRKKCDQEETENGAERCIAYCKRITFRCIFFLAF